MQKLERLWYSKEFDYQERFVLLLSRVDGKTYRDQSYPKAFPQINKRESNFPCSLAQITPDNKQRFNTHSVSLARAWANEGRWAFSSNTV